MDRNKSNRETQSQFLKEVLAEFDIETQVNKIAIRCFNDLLKSNKQAFDVIIDSEKKISEFQTRLVRTEGFAESIEKNVSNKIDIANNLNRRLQTFSTEFYGGLKENQVLLRTMRKDYDTLVASTQKNTYEIRSLSDLLKKNTDIIQTTGARVQSELSSFSIKINENQVSAQKQLVEIRLECEGLRQSLTQARTYFLSKSSEYQQVTKDMTLYKFDKDSINKRIVQLMKEVEMRMYKSEFNEMRLLFDSRMVTDEENNLRAYSELRTMIKEEKDQRKEDVNVLAKDNSARWKEQDKTNQSVYNKIKDNQNQLITRMEKMTAKQEATQIALRAEVEALAKKEDKDIGLLREQFKKQAKQIEQNTTKIGDCEKFMQERYEEMIELNSTVNAIGERLEMIIRENEQRRKEMSRIESSQNQSQLGESVNGLNQVIAQLHDQIISTNLTISGLSKEITQLKAADLKLKFQLQQQEKDVMEAINNEKSETQNKFTQVNRHISDVSIQIMNSLHSVEVESKSYVDGLIESIRTKLQFLDRVNQQIIDLKKAFQDQMRETQAVNQSITEKMEKANAGMTKFKSDLSLRVDAIVNEQQRRGLETKELIKQGEDIRKQLGYLTEGICVTLAVQAYREFLEDNEGVKEIKISSLIEGWVLEIDDKQAKYRGDHLNRRRLVTAYLNFFVFNSDKVKGGLIESGKDVYIRMIEESQEIFTSRKKGLIKKIGSELPKLHL